MSVYGSDLRTRQLEWARDEAERARTQRNDAVRELFRLRDVARLASRVAAGLDEDGYRTEPPGGYDGYAALVNELRDALARMST